MFKNRPEAPKAPTPPATPVVLAPSASSSPKPAPAAAEERKPWEASPTREGGPLDDGEAFKAPAETADDIHTKDEAEAQRKKEEEEREAAEWVVQPEQVPGLKESGWTKEMDEMCVAELLVLWVIIR